MPEYIYYVESY